MLKYASLTLSRGCNIERGRRVWKWRLKTSRVITTRQLNETRLFGGMSELLLSMIVGRKDTNFHSLLERQRDCVCKKKKNVLVMGDFNQMCYETRDMMPFQSDSDQEGKLTNVLITMWSWESLQWDMSSKNLQGLQKLQRHLLTFQSQATGPKLLRQDRVFDSCIADHRLIYTVFKLSKNKTSVGNWIGDWPEKL